MAWPAMRLACSHGQGAQRALARCFSLLPCCLSRAATMLRSRMGIDWPSSNRTFTIFPELQESSPNRRCHLHPSAAHRERHENLLPHHGLCRASESALHLGGGGMRALPFFRESVVFVLSLQDSTVQQCSLPGVAAVIASDIAWVIGHTEGLCRCKGRAINV